MTPRLLADHPRKPVAACDQKLQGLAPAPIEAERNIANKISRGGFTAAFFIQCLFAVDCTTLRLEDA
jgi:hypothetical protein